MNKENKVTSQPLAKKIHDKAKEKGFELPESEIWWARIKGDKKFHLTKWLTQKEFNKDKTEYLGVGISSAGSVEIEEAIEYYRAYDIAELGEMLPKHTGGYFLKIQMDNKFYFSTHISEDYEDLHQEEEDTFAEAMGKMFYYLLDNDLL